MDEFKEIEVTIKFKAMRRLSKESVGSAKSISEVIANTLVENYKNSLLVGNIEVTIMDGVK